MATPPTLTELSGNRLRGLLLHAAIVVALVASSALISSLAYQP